MLRVEIFNWLNDSTFVKKYEVLDFRAEQNILYLKLKITFTDDSVLFTREYTDETMRDYSFHWQDKNKVMLIRWDNAPHFKEIITFPHHKHLSDNKVAESYDISLLDILKIIDSIK